jgi:hypothetical protein
MAHVFLGQHRRLLFFFVLVFASKSKQHRAISIPNQWDGACALGVLARTRQRDLGAAGEKIERSNRKRSDRYSFFAPLSILSDHFLSLCREKDQNRMSTAGSSSSSLSVVVGHASRHRRVLGKDYVLPYVALEWDHIVGKPNIKWLVVRCADIRSKCGGPQSLAPRADIAYFVHPETAEADARLFARLKNAAESWPPGAGTTPPPQCLGGAEEEKPEADLARHCVFAWDHLLLNEAPLRWAVLEWVGREAVARAPDIAHPRTDVAYFLDPVSAEADARLFADARDRC